MLKQIIKKALLNYALKNARTKNLDVSLSIGRFNIFTVSRNSILELDKDIVINNYVSIYAEDNAKIKIGERVFIGDYSTIRATRASISIGANTMVAQGVKLISTNHYYKSRFKLIHQQDIDAAKIGITIGEDCWLCAGCVVLPGVTLGNGVVVGANAVVTKNVPDYAVIAGIPGKIISYRS